MEHGFTPGPRSRLKRYSELGHYDHATLFKVLDAAMIANIGYAIDGQSFTTPTVFWREGTTLYWHGSSASRMIRAHAAGLDVCVGVMLVDGLVLARSPFNHSINYRSMMAFGRTRPVLDPLEKEAALDRFMRRYFPGRLETLRPTSTLEMKATGVIAMAIEEASAKIADSGPTDEPGDSDYDCWAGVIPVRQILGEAEPAADLRPGIAFPQALEVFSPERRLDQVLTSLAPPGGS